MVHFTPCGNDPRVCCGCDNEGEDFRHCKGNHFQVYKIQNIQNWPKAPRIQLAKKIWGL